MARLLHGISDEQLDASTPCPDYRLGDLVDHVGGLSLAFTWAAAKDPRTALSAQGPSGAAQRLEPDWRTTTASRLDALAQAWKEPAAWSGMTAAGGVDLPGDAAGLVALDELVLHGWDVAVASGQDFGVDLASLEAVHGFTTAMSMPAEQQARQGLFGPVVPVPDGAPLLDRVLGLAGRDPRWSRG